MVAGHKKIIGSLQKLAAGGSLPHGYIFFGPAMVGKRTVAAQFANFLEAGDFAEPKMLQDALVISPDAKGTLGIDAIRALKHFLSEKPNTSPKRTAIIEGGELLTAEAQGALLKVAEEPPPSALLILITSDPDGLLPTISSRLQKIYFGTVPEGEIAEWLTGNGAAKKAAESAAKMSFGKPGLALSFLADGKFQQSLRTAENLLKSSDEKRRDLVKKLLEDEEFDFAKLLDAMILAVASDAAGDAKKMKRWHKFLALRHDAAYFNLNPKLQLENLLKS